MVLKLGDPNLTWHFMVEWVKNYVGFNSLLVWSIKVSINAMPRRKDPAAICLHQLQRAQRWRVMGVCIDTRTLGTTHSSVYHNINWNVRLCVQQLKPGHSWVMQQNNDPKHRSKSITDQLKWPCHSPDLKSTQVLWLIKKSVVFSAAVHLRLYLHNIRSC